MSMEKSNNNEKILERLNLAAKSTGLNNSQISEVLGYSKGQVGWVLAGKATLTNKFAQIFCSKFNISNHWLLTGEGDMYETPPPVVSEASTGYNDKQGELSVLRKLAIEEMSRMTDDELERFISERLARKHRKGRASGE